MSNKTRALDAIGGSDVAAIRGENQYKTALQVWRRIVLGEPEPEAGLAADIGTAAEEAIICDWCRRNVVPRQSVERNVELCDPHDERKRGEVDGLVRQHSLILDAKLVLSPGVFKQWGDEGTDYMPVHILNQQAWYCAIAERAGIDVRGSQVIAVIGGQPRDYFYSRVPAYEAQIMADVDRFLVDHVDTGIPPEVQTVDDALWKSPEPKSDVRPATDAERALVERWRKLKELADEAGEQVERAKARVCDAIGESEGIWLGGNDRVTWKMSKSGVRSLRG